MRLLEEIQLTQSRNESSAAAALLKVMCDVVIELDEEFTPQACRRPIRVTNIGLSTLRLGKCIKPKEQFQGFENSLDVERSSKNKANLG